ncbi:MAG: hypothetical protein HY821_24310 [Acidobacteria bacterium]|nr:hypothetical protein [Acidobacteriota bacterium]
MAAVAAGCLALGAVGLEGYIGVTAYRLSQQASERFGGDRVEGLIQQVECTSCAMKERNLAVWALGQIGDQRALPVLREHETGKACNHTKELCQHELTKAIRHIERGIPLHSVLKPKS